MLDTSVSLVFAFVAGLVSFLSPCVLPLIPGYLAYLAGTTVKVTERQRWVLFLNSTCFVLGFSLVFAALGVLLNTVLSAIAYDVQLWLSRVGGVIIIIFGLYLTGLVKLPWLDQGHTLQVTHQWHSRYLTSLVFGAAFAVGWTPCVGAVLGSILSLAATQPGSAFALLLAYALGLGIPFLLVGLFTFKASQLIERYGQWTKPINIIFGVALIILGMLIFTQSLNLLANFSLLNRLLLQ